MNKDTQRNTRQRMMTLEELKRTPCHPTAAELYSRLQKVLPRISLGTVYRNLQVLCDCGQAVKLTGPDQQARYDATTAVHAHVFCTACGKAADVMAPPLPDLVAAARPTERYTIVGYRLEFAGICPACQRSIRSTNPTARHRRAQTPKGRPPCLTRK